MKKIFVFILLIITLGMGFFKSYVTVVPSSTVTFQKEDTLVYAIDNIPDTISATDILSREEEDLICSVFSGLVELNENGEAVPDLAKAWKISEDGLEYTFKIKENLKWSNGEKITAESFQLFFRDLLSPANDAYTSEELYTIYGVKEYREGKHDFSKVAINTPDKYTITIRMNNKDEELLRKLSKPLYRLRNLNDPLDNYKVDFNKISYTGPYLIEEITKEGFVRLAYNPYSDIELEIEDVLLKEKEDDEIELAAFNLNKVDILRNPPIINLDGFNLYKNTSVYKNDVAKVMILNENIKDDIYIILKNWISESNIIKNNIGSAYVEVLNKNNIKELFKEDNKKTELKLDENYDDRVNISLKDIYHDKEVLKIVISDSEEEKVLANELKKKLQDEYKIKTSIKSYSDDFKDIIKLGEFDIAFIDITKEELDYSLEDNKYTGKLDLNNEEYEEAFKSEEIEKKVFISVYFENDLWCKSNRVNYTYIDGNGNLILKYSSY